MITRETELSYFFTIMGNLASAKAASDLVGVADSIADLEAMAMWSDSARIRRNAGAQADQASDLLADLQAQRFGNAGSVVVMTRADCPANLN